MDAEDITLSPESLAKLIKLTENGTINGTVAKEVFEVIFEKDMNPEKYVEEHGLKQNNDEDGLKGIILKVIGDNPQSVQDYHNGKDKAIGFLVGQTMKEENYCRTGFDIFLQVGFMAEKNYNRAKIDLIL